MARGTFVISTQDSYLARVQRTLSGRLGNNGGGEGGKHARGDGRLIGLEMAGRSVDAPDRRLLRKRTIAT